MERTLRTAPADATHWSIRSMASETGFSHTTIRRMWVAFGLQPHRSQTFKLSTDPLFVDKVRDIVGFYLSPPNRVLFLSVDEKSQIQALDREQPVLPMMPGVAERRTHNYIRHGTTSLFAALDVASGFVIGKCYKRHRAAEFLNFLKEVDARVAEGLEVQIIMDNYATHKTQYPLAKSSMYRPKPSRLALMTPVKGEAREDRLTVDPCGANTAAQSERSCRWCVGRVIVIVGRRQDFITGWCHAFVRIDGRGKSVQSLFAM